MSTFERRAKRKREDDGGDLSDGGYASSSSEIVVSNNGRDDNNENDDAPINETQDEDILSDEEDEAEYGESRESFPKCAAYDPEIQKVKQRLISIAQKAHDVFNMSSCETMDVQKLRSKTKQVLEIPLAENKIIGLIGNAGQGKSSLVNSIIDIPDLAMAMDMGSSVTFVVMVYQRAPPNQRQRFSARVEYYDYETIRDMLGEILESWRIYFVVPDKDWDDDEKAEYYNRAMTAHSTFRAIFCDLDQFSTEENTTETLDKLTSTCADSEAQFGVFEANLKERLGEPNEEGKCQRYYEAANTVELRDWLDPHLTEDPDYEAASLWPLVKKVDIGVRGSRVLDCWTIADLPGLSDTHQVRVNTTLAFINDCAHLWICDRLGRIVTGTVVDPLLQKYGKPFQGNVTVVATKSDDGINAQVIQALVRKDQQLKVKERQWKTTVAALDAQIKTLKPAKGARRLRNEATADQIEELKEARKRHEDDRYELMVQARNASVTRDLRKAFQKHVPHDKPLNVFCISNTQYEAVKNPEGQTYQFQLSAETTGIPGLRAHALALAAPAAFQALQDFIDHKFSVFIGGCDMWASNNLIEGRADLISLIKPPGKSGTKALNKYRETVYNEVQNMIIIPLKEKQDDFAATAQSVVEKIFQQRLWATLKAFITRYGNHSTPAMVGSWNERFTKPVKEVLDKIWPTFVVESERHLAQLHQKVLLDIAKIEDRLEKEQAAVSLSTDGFKTSLKARIEGLRQNLRESEATWGRDLRVIRINATVDGPDNYFANAMREAYQRCIDDHGKGVKTRWQKCLVYHLVPTKGSQSPFGVMADSIQKAIGRAVRTQATALMSHVDEVLQEIAEDFKEMITGKKKDDSEGPMRDALQEFLKTATPEFEDIKKTVEKIKARYPGEV